MFIILDFEEGLYQMNKVKAFFYLLTGSMAVFTTAAATEIVSYSQEEMAQFLEKFPELNECTVGQQEEALAFYKKTEAVQKILAEASQAIETSNGEGVQEKISEAADILQQMAEH